MCVAVVRPKGQVLTEAVLKACWDANRDGAGFAYIKEGKTEIDTGHMTFDAFMQKYQPIADQYGADHAMLVHFRIRSAGNIATTNCHPFPVKGGAMIHNGTLFRPSTKHGTKSDTNVFCEQLYDKLTLENVDKIKGNLKSLIGTYNKLAFLYDTGDYRIINEDSGIYRNGSWFSNSYWERSK